MYFDVDDTEVFNVISEDLCFMSCPQYRAWLQSNFRASPFNDQEQVGALLQQYSEQQESQRGGADQRWIREPPSTDDPEGST